MSEPALQKSRGVWPDDFIGTLLDKDAIIYYLEEGFNPELLPKQEARAIWHFVREYFEGGKKQKAPTLEVLTTEFPTWRFVEPNAEPHWILKNLKEQWERNQSQTIVRSASTMEPEEVYPYLKEKLFEMEKALESERNVIAVEDWDSMMDEYLAEYEAGDRIGYTSGFEEIDAVTGGFRPSNLILINGRLKQGKTWFGIKAWIEQRRQRVNPIIFTLEISPREMWLRVLAIVSGVSYDAIDKQRITPGDVKLLIDAQKEAQSWGQGYIIQPPPGYRRVPDLLTYVDKYKCGSMIVDQLDWIDSRGSRKDYSRDDLRLGDIAMDLKLAAQRPGREMPVYVMHQFSRQQGKDTELDSANIAGSDQPARHADLILGIQQSKELYEQKQIKIEIMDARSSDKSTWYCDFEFYEKTRFQIAERTKSDFDQAVEQIAILSSGQKVNTETGELVGSVETQ